MTMYIYIYAGVCFSLRKHVGGRTDKAHALLLAVANELEAIGACFDGGFDCRLFHVKAA